MGASHVVEDADVLKSGVGLPGGQVKGWGGQVRLRPWGRGEGGRPGTAAGAWAFEVEGGAERIQGPRGALASPQGARPALSGRPRCLPCTVVPWARGQRHLCTLGHREATLPSILHTWWQGEQGNGNRGTV